MKAGVLRGIGQIACEEVPVPTIGESDVLVAVKRAGICGSDLERVFKTGTWQFPRILGHEFAGEIAVVGERVAGLSVGDRVAVNPMVPCGHCDYCLQGTRNLCVDYDYLGSRSDGGFAEFARVPAGNVLRLPDELDWDDGASTDPITVALHAVRQGGVRAGDTALVSGCGPIGDYIIQWVKALGATLVVAVDVVPQKLSIASASGADVCVDATSQDLVATVMDLTRGRGASISFEAAGAVPSLNSCLQVTAKGGRVVCVGTPHGEVTLSYESFEHILRRELNIIGTWCYNFPEIPVQEWKLSLQFQSQGRIKAKPVITHHFTLRDIADAFELIRTRREFFNKILIVP